MPCPLSEVAVLNSNMGDRCSPLWLTQRILLSEGVLLLDCRLAEEYNASHISGAMHVTIPTLMMRRLKKGNLSIASVINCNEGKERFKSQCKAQPVVCYDSCTTDIDSNPTCLVSLLVRKLKEDGCSAYVLEGGFSRFGAECTDYCISQKDSSLQEGETPTILGLRNLNIHDDNEADNDVGVNPSMNAPFPVEVLPFLYLGNAKNSADLECLYKNSIRYILNVTPNVPNTFETDSTFKYMQIPINDHWSQNLASFFQDAISFIDEARRKKCGVLVHCLAGISRSVTVTVAYLMHHSHLTLNDAYDFVKKCKPNISPNFNFMGQLLDYERTLQGEQACTCQCAGPASSPAYFGGGDVSDRLMSPPSSNTDSMMDTLSPINKDLRHQACHCLARKTYFSSPSTSSASSGSSSVTSTTSSATEFDYEVPPTPS